MAIWSRLQEHTEQILSTPFFPALLIDGQEYDFSHLDPFSIHIDSRKAGKILDVRVKFTTHCFTMKHSQEMHLPGHPILKDQGGRERLFCSIRYRLSHDLPALIEEFCHGKISVWQTSTHRNWSHSVKIEDPGGPYHIFFELRKAQHDDPRIKQDLDLTVESAYHEDPLKGPPALRGKMRFDILCGKVYLREPTATQKGGRR